MLNIYAPKYFLAKLPEVMSGHVTGFFSRSAHGVVDRTVSVVSVLICWKQSNSSEIRGSVSAN